MTDAAAFTLTEDEIAGIRTNMLELYRTMSEHYAQYPDEIIATPPLRAPISFIYENLMNAVLDVDGTWLNVGTIQDSTGFHFSLHPPRPEKLSVEDFKTRLDQFDFGTIAAHYRENTDQASRSAMSDIDRHLHMASRLLHYNLVTQPELRPLLLQPLATGTWADVGSQSESRKRADGSNTTQFTPEEVGTMRAKLVELYQLLLDKDTARHTEFADKHFDHVRYDGFSLHNTSPALHNTSPALQNAGPAPHMSVGILYTHLIEMIAGVPIMPSTGDNAWEQLWLSFDNRQKDYRDKIPSAEEFAARVNRLDFNALAAARPLEDMPLSETERQQDEQRCTLAKGLSEYLQSDEHRASLSAPVASWGWGRPKKDWGAGIKAEERGGPVKGA